MCSSPRRSALALGALLGACAGAPQTAPPATVAQDLPIAARAVTEARGAEAGSSPLAVRVEDPRAQAEALARRVVDAVLRADEDALRPLFTEVVEGTEGDTVEGRERVIALIRPWLSHIARVIAPTAGRALAPRVYAPEECAPSTCGGVFLRRGDWFMVLPIPGLRPAPHYRTVRGVGGGLTVGGVPTTAPPRYFVLRPVEGALRVVAVNDDLLRTR